MAYWNQTAVLYEALEGICLLGRFSWGELISLDLESMFLAGEFIPPSKQAESNDFSFVFAWLRWNWGIEKEWNIDFFNFLIWVLIISWRKMALFFSLISLAVWLMAGGVGLNSLTSTIFTENVWCGIKLQHPASVCDAFHLNNLFSSPFFGLDRVYEIS